MQQREAAPAGGQQGHRSAEPSDSGMPGRVPGKNEKCRMETMANLGT